MLGDSKAFSGFSANDIQKRESGKAIASTA